MQTSCRRRCRRRYGPDPPFFTAYCIVVLLLASAYQPIEAAEDPPVGTARRTTETIRIDGRLDEVAWQQADPIEHFRQREPVENSEPSEQTSVRVLYDDNALYIG